MTGQGDSSSHDRSGEVGSSAEVGDPESPSSSVPWKWIAIGASALVVIVLVVVAIAGSGGNGSSTHSQSDPASKCAVHLALWVQNSDQNLNGIPPEIGVFGSQSVVSHWILDQLGTFNSTSFQLGSDQAARNLVKSAVEECSTLRSSYPSEFQLVVDNGP